MSLLDLLQAWLPLLVVLQSVVSGAVLWAYRRASKDDVAKVEARCASNEGRLALLEQTYKMLPTREDTHLLRLQMMEFNGEMRVFTERIEADRRHVVRDMENAKEHFNTHIEAATKLVARTESSLRILTEHLLSTRGKG